MDALVEKMKAQGAEFHFGEAVCQAEKTENGYKVITKSGLCKKHPEILPVGDNGRTNPIGIRGHR